jgi:chromosome segregation ATPase
MPGMESVFGAALVAAFAVVFVSFLGVVTGRATGKLLLAATVLLGTAAAGAAIAFGVNVADEFVDPEVVALATAGLAAATVAEGSLLALRSGLARLRDADRLVEAGRRNVDEVVAEHERLRASELENQLARERANAAHALTQQERKLAAERRDQIARQADRARAELAQSIELVQERLEQRLTAWAADLDRGQRALETRLTELAHRQAEAIKAYEARLAADSDYLRTATEEQQAALGRLRTELQEVGRQLLQEGQSDLELHAEERRRALNEVSGRVRAQEKELRDYVEREEADSLTRIQAAFADVEQRQRDNLERSLDRASSRLVEDAERRFDAQIRQSREKSAQRLSNELDKAMEQYARRAEKEISDRIAEAAQQTAARLEKQVSDITRAAEGQHEVSAERLRGMSERIDEALDQAERRIASFEEQIEEQMASRLAQLEQSVRAAGLQ